MSTRYLEVPTCSLLSVHRGSRSLSACRNAGRDGTCTGQLSPGTAAGGSPWPLADLADDILAIIHTDLAPYALPATQEIHAIRAFRSLTHGFVSLELAGGFGLLIDLDESYRTLIDLLVMALERQTAT
jgi:hypothetical protein